MDTQQFNVVVDGTLLDGFDTDDVLVQLQKQLKLSEAKARVLISGKALAVKRNVEQTVAESYCQRLLGLGVAARIEATSASIPPAAAETAAPATIASDNEIYFSTVSLTANDIANTADFSRAVMRAGLTRIGVTLAYLAAVLIGLGLMISYGVHYVYLFSIPPLFFSATVYFVFLSTLGILTALVLRPLLMGRTKNDSAILLSQTQEPALFAFVAQLCDALKIKTPAQIGLSADSSNTLTLIAGIKNFVRGEYRLMLSLPIIENGTRTHLAGLLAADLATYKLPLLRYRCFANFMDNRLNACLVNRDWIAHGIDKAPQWIKPALLIDSAKKLIELTNDQLQNIFYFLQSNDVKLQREILLEQDRYSALIAGSKRFADLMIFRARLDSALHDANIINLENHADGKFVDDLPALIQHYYEGIDENFAQLVQRRWNNETTPRADEPPIMRERIEHAEAVAYAGIIDSEEFSRTLLRHRDELAQGTTLYAYSAADFNFDPYQLMPVEELIYAATQDMLQRQQAAIYFNDWLRPFRFWRMADYKLIHTMPLADAAVQLSVCVNEIRRLTPDRAKLFAEYERQQNQLREILLAQHVLAAGKKFSFRYINYDGTTLAPLVEDRYQQLAAVMEKLAEQETVMGGRITLGLRLSGQAQHDVEQLHEALHLLQEIGNKLHKLELDCYQLEQLLQRQYELREADYRLAIKKLETKIGDTCVLLIERAKNIPNPIDNKRRSLKEVIESTFTPPPAKTHSAILHRAQQLLDALYRFNEKSSRKAAEYGTIAEEAYRIEPIKLVNS